MAKKKIRNLFDKGFCVMKKIFYAMCLMLCLSGCTSSSVPAIRVKAKNAFEIGDKTGTQCSLYVLGIFGPFGNASIPGAAAAGGIKKIAYYDVTKTSYFFYSRRCLNVYGY